MREGRLGLNAHDPALEVGAGTGQLTDALLNNGLPVTALEPSTPMADRLRHRLRDRTDAGQLSVLATPFEEFTASCGYGSIWSADAWHWVDPDTAYASAAQMLRAGGYLIALWTLSALPQDVVLADDLNRVYSERSPDLIRDPRQPIDESSTAAGREQIEASGTMAITDYWTERSTIRLTADQYADWQLSFAQIAAMAQQQRDELRQTILQTLPDFGSGALLPVVLDRYVVVAKHA